MYLKLSISTMIAIKKIQFTDTESIINSLLSIVTLIFILACPIFSYLFLRKNKHRLGQESFKMRIASLYLNVDLKKERSTLLGTFFILRRLSFALIVVFMGQGVIIQILALTLGSIFMIKYLIEVKPLDSKFLNAMELFNECILLISFYFMIFFTDLVGDVDFKY